MGFDISRIKANAKSHYDVNKWNNVAVVLISMVLSSIVSRFTSNIDLSDLKNLDPETVENTEEAFSAIWGMALLGVTSFASLVEFVINLFVINILTMGMYYWYHKSIYQDKLDVKALFDPFRVKYLENVLTMLLKQVLIGLWSLLFIIPGVIKSYAYSMTEFIKTENPNVSAAKAIEISKKMTDGHKMDLFVLDLNFLGWHILGGITCGIVELIYAAPYHNAAKAFAYEELKAEALANGKITEDELRG